MQMDVQKYKSYISPNLQRFIDKHHKVFEDIPKVIPPTQDHDHVIHLIPRNVLLTLDLIDTPIAKRKKLSVWLNKC